VTPMSHALQNFSQLLAFVLLSRLLFQASGQALHLADTAQLFERFVGLFMFLSHNFGFFFADSVQPPHQSVAEQSPVAPVFIDEAKQAFVAFLQGILPPLKISKLPLRQTMKLRLYRKNALNSTEPASHLSYPVRSQTWNPAMNNSINCLKLK
jgi:hypothetical protein